MKNPPNKSNDHSKSHHEKRVRLGELRKGSKALITSIGQGGENSSELAERLLEMGFLEGALVEVVHEAPFGRDPFAVRVRGTLLALQREMANVIEVLEYAPESN